MKTLLALAACIAILGGCGQGYPSQDAAPKPVAVEKVKDPVCGMTIDKTAAKGHQDFKGGHYYFCMDDCTNKFKASPDTYVK